MTLEEQRLCMSPLQMAGLIIMENGGETFRVEETVTRMGTAFGLTEVESFAVPSGLFISYRMADGTVESSVKRVRVIGTDLERVDQVNDISRRVERGDLDPAAASAALSRIRLAPRSRKILPLGAGLCAAGFTLMFGGGWMEFGISFLLATGVQLLAMLLDRFHMQTLVSTLLGSVLSTLIPMLLTLLLPALKPEPLIAGALMPMLPGLMMTNAVQDTIRGDMVSGLSHGVQAILTASLVAGGALIADTLFRYMTGGGVL